MPGSNKPRKLPLWTIRRSRALPEHRPPFGAERPDKDAPEVEAWGVLRISRSQQITRSTGQLPHYGPIAGAFPLCCGAAAECMQVNSLARFYYLQQQRTRQSAEAQLPVGRS